INGDTLLDLITPEQILIGDGNGNFAATLVPGDPGIRVIAVADVTLDGEVDLLTELYPGFVTTLELLQNDGIGNFTAIESAANQALPANGGGVIADINGDTLPDWIVPTSSFIAVHLGNANFTFRQFVRLPLSALLPAKGFVNVAAADFNADSVMDLITTRLGDEAAIIVAGQSDGTLDLPSDSLPRIGGPGTFPVAHTRLVDLTGDNILDLVGDGLTVYRGNGDGTFAPPVFTSSPGVHFAFAPIDGDTIPDAVATDSAGNVVLLRGLGNGSFAGPTNVAALGTLGFGAAVFIEVLDATGDGLSDIAVAHTMGVTIIPGNSDGTFDAPVHTVAAAPIGFGRTLVVLDANNDSREDLVVPMGGFSDTLHLLFGNDDGTLTDVGTVGGPIGRQGKFVSAHFDGDGDADLVVVTADSSVGYVGQLLYFKGLGDGTFAAAVRVAVDDYVDILASDVDGDGTKDLVTAGLYEFSIYAGVGDGTFAAPTRFDLSATPGVILVGDVTGDSLVDIVAYEYLHVQNAPPALPMLSGGLLSDSSKFVQKAAPAPQISQASLDVSGDAIVSPLDALLVINFLNYTVLPRANALQSFAYDVNRDGYVSPLDILCIINYLNKTTELEASGESAPEPRNFDTFFESLSDESPQLSNDFNEMNEIIETLGKQSRRRWFSEARILSQRD
ncbi:MAG: FG-GAP-like repeat-containing protein, partial [Pirellula sp.]